MFTRILFCSTTLLSSIVQAQVTHHCLNEQDSQTIPLYSKNGNYIQGRIQFKHVDYAQEGVSAQLLSKGVKRSLFTNQTTEQNFLLWLPDKNTEYALHIAAPQQKRLCYTLNLDHQNAQLLSTNDTNPQPLDSPHLQQIINAADRQKQIERFWQYIQQQGTPLIEPINRQHSRVTFLYRGAQYNVRLIGAPSNDHEWLHRLPESDIWYKSFIVDNTLRLSYRLAPDVPTPDIPPEAKDASYQKRRALLSVLQADPLNAQRYGEQSLLDLNSPDSEPKAPLKGSLKQYAFSSKLFGNTRRIWLYHTGKNRSGQPIFVYLFDGQNYLDETQLLSNLDKLPSEMPPVYLVLIDNVERRSELPANPILGDMFKQELIPFIEQQTNIKHNPSRSVLSGSSYGGLATAFVAYQHSDLFKHLVPMSGSFWWKAAPQDADNGIKNLFANKDIKPLNWYISAGSYETSRNKSHDGILETSQELAQSLSKQGHRVRFEIKIGGHDYAIWEQVLPQALQHFFYEKIMGYLN